jgi:DNA-binding transcriptional LysR family regulator
MSGCPRHAIGSSLGPRDESVAFDIKAVPRLSADSASALLAFALAGCGVALLPEWLVAPALAEHRLIQVMPWFTFPAGRVCGLSGCAAYPGPGPGLY